MELKDKIIMLRKQNALSQEGLSEKLNVTRQTISKWELGETKPSVDMLNEMSKIFNVGIEVLTNDDIGLDSKKEKVKKPKNRKYILYILIVILIAAVITLAIRIGNDRENEKIDFGISLILLLVRQVVKLILNNLMVYWKMELDLDFSYQVILMK